MLTDFFNLFPEKSHDYLRVLVAKRAIDEAS